jgi:flagellar biosynthetic protein FliR
MNPPLINPAEILTFILVLIRVSMILFLAPIFGSPIVPAQVKIALALTTALLVVNLIDVDLSAYPVEAFSYVPIVLKELLIGLTIALMLRLVLEGVQFAGQFLGFQMGFAIVNVIDPQSGGQASVIAQFAYMLATLIFLLANGHHVIINAFVESFQITPPGALSMSGEAMRHISAAAGRLFVIAVKIAAPAMVVLFLAKVSMGIIAKVVPQMNILFVGMPMYIIIGLFIFGLSLRMFVPILGRYTAEANIGIFQILRAF